MLLQKVMVSHPGNVIANDPVHGFVLRLIEVKSRQASRVFQVVRKRGCECSR